MGKSIESVGTNQRWMKHYKATDLYNKQAVSNKLCQAADLTATS